MVPELLANPVPLFEFESRASARRPERGIFQQDNPQAMTYLQKVNVRGSLEIKTFNDLINGLLKNECKGSSQRDKRNNAIVGVHTCFIE